ncbi:hypothetical protein [Streptomyces sp. bgisy034]|uniref:hypothetical protein n=1 Tax=Streptomyces sp. bgisy034 TaxID=3413774 RepID=UPI003EC147E1
MAKQTIHRWWKSKVGILLDTLADDAREALAWDESGARAEEDLKAHLRRTARSTPQRPGNRSNGVLHPE